jgi:hypothetical protein
MSRRTSHRASANWKARSTSWCSAAPSSRIFRSTASMTFSAIWCASRTTARSASRTSSVVSRHYNVSRTDMLSNRRTRVIVKPRQIAMYLAKIMTPRSLPEIGRRFGGRDHTTVLHAVRKVEGMISEDTSSAKELELLKRLISKNKLSQPRPAATNRPGLILFPSLCPVPFGQARPVLAFPGTSRHIRDPYRRGPRAVEFARIRKLRAAHSTPAPQPSKRTANHACHPRTSQPAEIAEPRSPRGRAAQHDPDPFERAAEGRRCGAGT